MNVKVFCPNCQEELQEDELYPAEELGEYYCESCNTSFCASLIDEGDRQDKDKKGSSFNLSFENGKNYIWKKTNENLLPILTCMLCTGELGNNKDDNDESQKCRKCGALFNINNY